MELASQVAKKEARKPRKKLQQKLEQQGELGRTARIGKLGSQGGQLKSTLLLFLEIGSRLAH